MWTRCEPPTPRTRYKVASQSCLCRFLGLLTHTQAKFSGTILGPDARARRAPREALGRGARGPVETETEEAVAAGQFGGDLGGLIGRRGEVAPDLLLAGKAHGTHLDLCLAELGILAQGVVVLFTVSETRDWGLTIHRRLEGGSARGYVKGECFVPGV
jgi:hypothetical protein